MKAILAIMLLLFLVNPASAAFNISANQSDYGANDLYMNFSFSGVTEENANRIYPHEYEVIVYCNSCPLVDDMYPQWRYPELPDLSLAAFINTPINTTLDFIGTFIWGSFTNNASDQIERYPYVGSYTMLLIDEYGDYGTVVAETNFTVSSPNTSPTAGTVKDGPKAQEIRYLIDNPDIPLDLGSTGEPGPRINYIINSPWFWGGILILVLASMGMEEGGLAGAAVGGLIGIVLVVVYELMPLYAVFLLVIGMIAIIVSYTSRGKT